MRVVQTEEVTHCLNIYQTLRMNLSKFHTNKHLKIDF